jgi:hypothetical protein
MITRWTAHKEYLGFLKAAVDDFRVKEPKKVAAFQKTIAKLSSLNLDPLFGALNPYYANIGRPAVNQPEIFRSFILMFDQGETSVTNWQRRVAADVFLARLIGCESGKTPPLGSYYDFIDRLWLRRKSLQREDRKRLVAFIRKPVKKIKRGVKLSNKNAGVVAKIKKFLADGKSFTNRPERLIQELFALIAVVPSMELGLIDTRNLTVSGDGTCVPSKTSSRGIKVCECRKNGVFNCKCPRRFADPDAAWGFDSYKGQYFYGHTLYAFSYYNPTLSIDLPLVMRFVRANRHDSVSGPVALAELRQLSPQLPITNVCFDSANDNYATYELLKKWNYIPFIDLKNDVGRKPSYPDNININDNGVPVCAAGHAMVYNGNCKGRSRIKWRCPLKCGKVKACPCADQCSPSPYGRVFYTKPVWDLRLFTPVPRGSKEFKQTYRNRTSSERINNRLLNDYYLQHTNSRGKIRFSFFAMIAGINIHLDARIKASASA